MPLKPLFSIIRCNSKSSAKRSKTSFDDLPDECILLIFDRLPLHTLLRIGLVCYRWSTLQPVACKRRRSLTILVGNRYWFKSVDSDNPQLDELVNDDGMRAAGWWSNYSLVQQARLPLKVPEVDWRMAHAYVNLFPNVTTLRVAQCDVAIESIDPVVYMLNQWRHKLVTLKVMGFFRGAVQIPTRKEMSHLYSLLATINNLPQLKRLTVDLYHRLGSRTGSIELPIVAQLEQFSFQTIDNVDMVLDAIKPHVTKNSQLKQIHLRNNVTNLDLAYTTLYKMKPNMAHRFVELRLYSAVELPQLKRLGHLFINLKILQVSFSNHAMYHVARALEPLKRLECLHLNIEFPSPFQLPADLLPEEEMPVLSSVKGLSLNCKLVSHLEMEYLLLDHIFPNLQMIGLRNKSERCRACHINVDRFMGSLWHKRIMCARKICAPLKKCHALQRMYTDQQLYWGFDNRITVINRNVFHP